MSEIAFQGSSALSLDGKGRVTVPARHRDMLAEHGANQLTITKHHAGCLVVFPRPEWLRFREKLMALPVTAEGWRRLFLGNALDVEIDSGARVLVSPELRDYAGLSKDVMLLGMGTRLELWDATRYAEQEAKTLASAMPAAIEGFVF